MKDAFVRFWCRQQLDELTSQHEAYARQLRERLLREQDLTVERERAAAQDSLREAAERCFPEPCCCILLQSCKHNSEGNTEVA